MARYIDADAFIQWLKNVWDLESEWTNEITTITALKQTITDIKNTSIVDVVEVVRCKDCKYYKKNISCVGGLYNGCSEWLNEGNEIEVREDDYCSYGERREDET